MSLLALMLFALPETVFATVGGPTYVSQIAYDAANKAVYYLESDMGGRGCPPIVHTVDVAEIKDREIKTCDDVFAEFFNGNQDDEQKYQQFISETYQSFPYLGSVSLEKNRISVRVETLGERVENGEKFWTDFRATLTQDNREIGKLDFRGCSADQPHVFEGYRIPGTDAMAMLISNKGDCFEGGYVRERLFIIKGVTYHDTNIVRSFKAEAPTEPNTGNLIVRATSSHVQEDVNEHASQAPDIVGMLFAFCMFLFMGIPMGAFALISSPFGILYAVPVIALIVAALIARRRGNIKTALACAAAAVLGQWLSFLSWVLSRHDIPVSESTQRWGGFPSVAKAGFPISALELPPSPMGNDHVPMEMWSGVLTNHVTWFVVGGIIAMLVAKFAFQKFQHPKWISIGIALAILPLLYNLSLFMLWYD